MVGGVQLARKGGVLESAEREDGCQGELLSLLPLFLDAITFTISVIVLLAPPALTVDGSTVSAGSIKSLVTELVNLTPFIKEWKEAMQILSSLTQVDGTCRA
eukprot:805350-Pelagomonas_calceolata.AAC.2